MCHSMVKKNQCRCYNRVEGFRDAPPLSDLTIVDMEDIVSLGRADDFCPYYMARELKMEADVIFMPYNYLLDPRMSKSLGVELHENIIIFDEAHNIEKVCEDSVSVQIKTGDIDNAVEDVAAVQDLLMSGRHLDVEEVSFTPRQLNTFKEMLIEFKEQLHDVTLVQLALEGTVFDGDYIFTILEKAGVLSFPN